MRIVRHPLVARDLDALVDHIVEVTEGDFAAASRRLDEIDALVSDIVRNPMSWYATFFSVGRLAGPARRTRSSDHDRIST